MDITIKTEEGRFNYRVCGIIINNDRILAMHDELSPYFYLPGGRVSLHETAENAVLREIKEELEIDAEIIRPLWMVENFFKEDVCGENFHEICLYYLIDISKTDLLSRGDSFTLYERGHKHEFEWLSFDSLESEYIYPQFIKEKIFDLPEHLTLITEHK